jgi:hypothetical protein
VAELEERLKLKRSAGVVFIDSFDYTRMSFKKYKEFRDRHPDKLVVFLAQVRGKHKLRTDAADDVKFDADIKILVDGYIAFPRSRFDGNRPMVIWEAGARRHHGDTFVDQLLMQDN